MLYSLPDDLAGSKRVAISIFYTKVIVFDGHLFVSLEHNTQWGAQF